MLCKEHNLHSGRHPEPEQSQFPQPHGHQWTWTHPAAFKHQVDHIKSTWVSSLYKCWAYKLVKRDSTSQFSDSICLVTSLRTIKKMSHKRAKFNNWGSCRTWIQNRKRVSVGAIRQISSTSKVKWHSQDHRTIQNLII